MSNSNAGIFIGAWFQTNKDFYFRQRQIVLRHTLMKSSLLRSTAWRLDFSQSRKLPAAVDSRPIKLTVSALFAHANTVHSGLASSFHGNMACCSFSVIWQILLKEIVKAHSLSTKIEFVKSVVAYNFRFDILFIF